MEAWLRWISHGEGSPRAGQHELDLALALLETAQVTVLVLDGDARVVHVNRYFEQLSGYALEELRGRDWIELMVPEADRPRVRERFAGAIGGEATRNYVSPVRVRDGGHRIFEWHDRLLRDESGEPVALLGIGHDVTERQAAFAALERANAELELRVAERSRELAEANRALEENRRRLATIVENTTDGMVFLDAGGRFRYVNAAAEHALGVTSASLLGRRCADVWPCSSASPTGRLVESALEARRSVEWESPAPAGGRWLAGSAIPADDGLVVVFRDVTEERHARAVLTEREARLREAQKIAQLGSWMLDLRTGTLEWSDEVFAIFEQDRARFVATYDGFLALVHPEDRALVDAEYRRSVESRTSYDYLHRVCMPDGRVKHVRERGRTDYDDDGMPLRSIGTVQDVTREVLAERAMMIKDTAIESSLNAIGIADLDGRATWVNAAFVALWGLDGPSAALGRQVESFFADRAAAREVTARLHEHGVWSGRLEIERADGEPRMVEVSAHLVQDPAGRPLCTMGSFVDVTARVAAELEVEAANEALTVFKQLTESANQPIGIARATGSAIFLNQAMRDLLELPPDLPTSEVNVHAYYTPETLEWVARDVAPRLETGEPWSGEVDLRTHTGRTRRTIHHTFLVRDLSGAPIGVANAITDITARREAELELRRSREALLHAESLARMGSWEWSLGSGELRGSPELYRQFGVDPARGRITRDDAQRRVHPDDRERARAYVESVMTTGHAPPVEYRVVGDDGEIRWLRAEASRDVSDRDGSLLLFGFSQDITEKKAAEERIAAQLREKEILLREIHHRVKNNLQVISSLLYFQAIRCEDPEVEKLFRESRDRVRAMAFVHETLYESADLGRVEFRRYAETLTRALAVSYAALECRVRFVVEASGAELDIEDAVPCGLVASELVTNALKYAFVGREEGTIHVSMRALEGDELRLAVADDGVGMDAGASPGGSLGLRLVRALAEQLRGRLEIRSDASGTEIAVVFPVRAPSLPA
jgi:PAS domain S-box-containing protein